MKGLGDICGTCRWWGFDPETKVVISASILNVRACGHPLSGCRIITGRIDHCVQHESPPDSPSP